MSTDFFDGTIYNNPEFHPMWFSEKLDRALRINDQEKVIELIISISNEQRQKLRAPYKLKYGKDIMVALDSKLSGNVEKIVFALMNTGLDYDTKQLRQAVKSPNTGGGVLIEILCSRSNDEIKAICAEYEKRYTIPLEEEVSSEFSGALNEFFCTIIRGERDASDFTDDEMARKDADSLFKAVIGGTTKNYDEYSSSPFLRILSTQNASQLLKISDYYIDIAGNTLENAIDREFSGDLGKAYLAVLQIAANKPKFFAKQLNDAVMGFGTRENDLIRVIVSRSEVDLNLIRHEFRELYGKSLEEVLKIVTFIAFAAKAVGRYH